jgi:hypothetical protein
MVDTIHVILGSYCVGGRHGQDVDLGRSRMAVLPGLEQGLENLISTTFTLEDECTVIT